MRLPIRTWSCNRHCSRVNLTAADIKECSELHETLQRNDWRWDPLGNRKLVGNSACAHAHAYEADVFPVAVCHVYNFKEPLK